MICIDLEFAKDQTGLAGNDSGRYVFNKQIKPRLEKAGDHGPAQKIVLIFPSQITRVAISFTQGLTFELANKYGRANLPRILEIKTGRESLTEKIYRDMVVSL